MKAEATPGVMTAWKGKGKNQWIDFGGARRLIRLAKKIHSSEGTDSSPDSSVNGVGFPQAPHKPAYNRQIPVRNDAPPRKWRRSSLLQEESQGFTRSLTAELSPPEKKTHEGFPKDPQFSTHHVLG